MTDKADKLFVHTVSEYPTYNKYVGHPYCLDEMYAGRVACCPLVSHGEYTVYADGTDRRTPGRYITLSARRGQRNNIFVENWHFFLPTCISSSSFIKMLSNRKQPCGVDC